MLKFAQLNLHKASMASMLAGQTMEGAKQRIMMLTEPYTVQGKVVNMPRRCTVIYDRSGKPDAPPPRAAIVASPDLQVNSMDSWCNRDCAVALAKIQNKQTLLISVYRDIKKPVVESWLQDLMDMANDKNLPVLICMDSNAHSDLFGPDNNVRGEALEDFILTEGLYVENTGMTPTFETRRGDRLIQTHIDVTLTKNLHFFIQDWRVDQGYNASDHNTILFGAETNRPTSRTIRPWSKANWTVFKERLQAADYRVPQNMSMKKLDRLVERLYQVLTAALDLACPEVVVEPVAKDNVWSTDKHTRAKEKVSELYRAAKRTGILEDWNKYKAEDRQFKKMCHNDKNKAWRKFKESIQTEKDMAALARMAQRQESRDINVLTKPDGSSTDPGKETIDLLTQVHFPAATNAKHVTYNNRRNATTEHICQKFDSWITKQLTVQALAGFEKKKSPGPDGIKPIVFEHLPDEFISVLVTVYKATIHLGYTPKQWKKTKVVYISKPGKDSYDQPKSFRPISLSNYLLKGLERLVGWKMDLALLTNPIHHKQHGFLAGKSTESAISNTVDYIERHIMNRQHCVGVFLDISSAFDSISPGHIRKALLKHGGDPEMVQWYYDYITHRDIIVNMHGVASLFSTGVGFPQGGVCSAKFWLIAFDTAIQIINTMKIEGNGYADDCSALYGGPRIDHAIARLQRMLDKLTAWGRTCGLRFNPEKSVAVLFTRRRKQPKKKLIIDGKEIAFKQEVKYLGVTLDSKLHWTPHIAEKIGKAKRFIGHVAAITRKNWGPKPKLMRWAYLSVVRPMLCYGAMIWGHRAPHIEAKLRRVNRMAINTMGSFPRSTPTIALEVMLDIPPLHLHCIQEGLAARLRLDEMLSLDWPGTNDKKTHSISHLQFWRTQLDASKLTTTNTDRCSIIKWNAGYSINRDSFDGHKKHRGLTQYNIFSDGSRQNNQSGAGFVICHGRNIVAEDHIRLPDYATVFQAEIVAIRLAVQTLLRQEGTSVRFLKIFVDSQAAIQALGNPILKSRTVAQAMEVLNEAASTVRKVSLVWIPAHRGHFGNSRADDLAKKGAGTTNPTKMLHIPKPEAAVKETLRTYCLRLWTKQWTENPTALATKQFYLSPNPQKARYVYKLARLELGRFVRIITGHNNLNYFQTRIGLWGQKLCRFCEERDETFAHLLHDCPRFYASRTEIFKDDLPTSDMTWSVRKLIDFSYTPSIDMDSLASETESQGSERSNTG